MRSVWCMEEAVDGNSRIIGIFEDELKALKAAIDYIDETKCVVEKKEYSYHLCGTDDKETKVNLYEFDLNYVY